MSIQGMKIAVLATDGFEESELTAPVQAFEKEGALVDIISLLPGTIRGWSGDNWTHSVAVTLTLDEAQPKNYDLLVLPGGVINPDRLRLDPLAVQFVRTFFDLEKPVAAICHGVQLLIEADVLRGRTVTSWPSLKKDIENAGAQWIDSRVVDDNRLITSRKPADLPGFIEKIMQVLARNQESLRRIPSLKGRKIHENPMTQGL